MAYLGTKPANQVIDSTLIADGTITPSDLSTGKPVWDTSGNVGIGTSSPQDVLHLTQPAGTAAIRIASQGGGSLTWRIASQITGVSNTGFTIRDDTNSANRLSIDGSGCVTIPAQPAFQTAGASYSLVANQIWAIRPSEIFNTGNCYNVSNGRFTAPVAGRYHFHFLHTTGTAGVASPNLYFRINGSGVYGQCLNYYGQYSSSTQVVVLSLNAGDYVEAIVESWNSAAVFVWTTSWGGYLIG
jgi:hypothetical protein